MLSATMQIIRTGFLKKSCSN